MTTTKVNGITVYYEIHGRGEPLVLIAGLASDIIDYKTIIVELSQGYEVIAFDNRGVGRTDKPDIPYSIDMMADDTAGLLSVLGIERAHVVGVSMGGRIAVALALKHPEQVRSLVLVSTFVKRVPMSWSVGVLGVLRVLIDRATRRKYSQPYYAFVRQRNASRSYDATDRLGEIHVPTLILHGKNDRLAPYELAEEIHNGIKGSKLSAFDGGHLFLFQKQEQFLDTVVAFLESQRVRQLNGVRVTVLACAALLRR